MSSPMAEGETFSSTKMAEAESVFNILLILIYIALPVFLILLRCITIKNIPKTDIFFLFNAFTAWFWIIWFLFLYNCPEQEWWPFGGLQGETAAFMTLGSVMSFILAVVFEPMHAWSFTCGLSDSEHQPLPIEFDATSVEEFRDTIAQIQDTGPTLIAGVVVEHDSFKIKQSRTSFWGLGGWEQFPYKSWVNLRQPHPYFHQDELEAGNFHDLDDVFSHPGPLLIKTTLDVLPANDITAEKYKSWILSTHDKMVAEFIPARLKRFTEEMVTVERLFDEHRPNRLSPSLQLPSLVTKETENLFYSHMMEARDRFFCEEQPWWLNKSTYIIFSCLLLSSLYRVFYWIAVKVVRLNFRKSFNTEESSTFSADMHIDSDAIQPYKNHIQNFVTKPFT